MTAFDWPGLMRVGLGVLRLKPSDFWSLTPAELLLMLGLQDGATATLSRERLQELAQQYPDNSGD